jgi:hypothetical protein
MFALGDRSELEALFRRAGFQGVEVRALSAPRRFASLADAVRTLREAQPAIRALTAALDEGQQKRAWAEIEQALQPFDGPSGFEAPGEMLVAAGRK